MVGAGFRFGEIIYGKTDIVPGLFYVGTKFLHFDGFPLFPLGSVLAYENLKHQDWSTGMMGSDGAYASKPIAFSAKSLLTATARIILMVTNGLSLIAALVLLRSDGFSSNYGLYLSGALLMLAASTVLLYLSYSTAVATRERALALSALAGFPEEVVLRHLEFKGYPLRRPKKEFYVKRCPECGELWPLELGAAKAKGADCPECRSRQAGRFTPTVNCE